MGCHLYHIMLIHSASCCHSNLQWNVDKWMSLCQCYHCKFMIHLLFCFNACWEQVSVSFMLVWYLVTGHHGVFFNGDSCGKITMKIGQCWITKMQYDSWIQKSNWTSINISPQHSMQSINVNDKDKHNVITLASAHEQCAQPCMQGNTTPNKAVSFINQVCPTPPHSHSKYNILTRSHLILSAARRKPLFEWVS